MLEVSWANGDQRVPGKPKKGMLYILLVKTHHLFLFLIVREKRRYYHGLLMQEELEDMDDSDEAGRTILRLGHGDPDDETEAPPMQWDRLKVRANPRGPTVRKTEVPRAAVYDEPKPPTSKTQS